MMSRQVLSLLILLIVGLGCSQKNYKEKSDASGFSDGQPNSELDEPCKSLPDEFEILSESTVQSVHSRMVDLSRDLAFVETLESATNKEYVWIAVFAETVKDVSGYSIEQIGSSQFIRAFRATINKNTWLPIDNLRYESFQQSCEESENLQLSD